MVLNTRGYFLLEYQLALSLLLSVLNGLDMSWLRWRCQGPAQWERAYHLVDDFFSWRRLPRVACQHFEPLLLISREVLVELVADRLFALLRPQHVLALRSFLRYHDLLLGLDHNRWLYSLRDLGDLWLLSHLGFRLLTCLIDFRRHSRRGPDIRTQCVAAE